MQLDDNEDNEISDVQRREEDKLTKAIWSCITSPKMKLFLWKITHKALPLGDNLARRGMLAHSTCRHCGELETAEHLFLHCPFTRRIWDATLWKQRFDPPDMMTFASALYLSPLVTNLPPLGATVPLFPWICWGIWTARNQFIFENRRFEPAEIISNALCQAKEWTSAQLPPRLSVGAATRRLLPTVAPPSTVTCFTDAAWLSTTNRAGCGWCIEDTSGSTLPQGQDNFSHIASALMAEALAVRSALIHAVAARFHKICIKSDCQALIAAISSKSHAADLYGIIRDIETLSSSFLFVSFSFIPRTMNCKADLLAKAVLHSSSSPPV
ncbi:hypothetical protein Bca4012_084425 [Brassica carinata]